MCEWGCREQGVAHTAQACCGEWVLFQSSPASWASVATLGNAASGFSECGSSPVRERPGTDAGPHIGVPCRFKPGVGGARLLARGAPQSNDALHDLLRERPCPLLLASEPGRPAYPVVLALVVSRADQARSSGELATSTADLFDGRPAIPFWPYWRWRTITWCVALWFTTSGYGGSCHNRVE